MSDWKFQAEKKRAQLIDQIPIQWRLSRNIIEDDSVIDVARYIDTLCSEQENTITSYPLTLLVEKLQNRQLTALSTLQAFAKRACYAHQLTNCLSEIFIHEALERAKQLDHHFAITKTPIGPLHGIPISFKDSFNIAGVPTRLGFVAEDLDFPVDSRDETELVTLLRESGSIFFVKTSVPTGVWSPETNSNLIGYTKNARNRRFSSGGSSGGEAALIAARGSPFGFGTDVGGSVRQPAAFEGIIGFKPSSYRFPVKKIYDNMYDFKEFPAAVGAFAPHARSIELIFNIILREQWQSLYSKSIQAWKKPTCFKKLRIGIMPYDGLTVPTPPVIRAIGLAKEALSDIADFVDFKPVNGTAAHSELITVSNNTMGRDGYGYIYAGVEKSGEPVPQTIGGYSSMSEEPSPLTKQELDKNTSKLAEAQISWKKFLETNLIDLLLCPVTETTSWLPELFIDDNPQSYTVFVNALDFPAVSVPVTKVSVEDDICVIKDLGYPVSNDETSYDFRNYHRYDAKSNEGMPVAVQLVGLPTCEEKVLETAAFLADKVNPF